jgi:hypothetical protein
MITLQEYQQALSDPDFFIRSVALEILSCGTEVVPQSRDIALKMVDKYGWEGAFMNASSISMFPLDQKNTEWAVERMEKCVPSNPSSASSLLCLFDWVSQKAPLELLPALVPKLEEIYKKISEKGFKPSGLKVVLQRIECSKLSGDELVERLVKLADQYATPDGGFDGDYEAHLPVCRSLVELEGYQDTLKNTVSRWLEADLAHWEEPSHYLTNFALLFAGLLKMEALLPRILQFLREDCDYTRESVERCLLEMRNAHTLSACAEAYPTLDWAGRIYLVAFFHTNQFPEIESPLIGLLEKEPSIDLRVKLATALVLFGTPDAQRLARAVYDEEQEQQEEHDGFQIAKFLLLQFHIQGIQDPQVEEWRESLEWSHHETMADFYKSLDRVLNPRAKDTPPAVAIPSLPKTGRNDLCPCGSGKKYKKCCLKQ